MKILGVTTENIKRCKFASVRFDGSAIVIAGDNAQGKSSFVDSIWMALGGAAGIPAQPVSTGATMGTISIEMDEFKITRKIKPDRSTTLEICSLDGAKHPSPQKILDAFNVRFGFWPSEFLAASEKDQAVLLKDVVGLDFTALDARAADAYNERTGVNRELKALQAQLEACPASPHNTPVDVAKLADELTAANDNNRKLQLLRDVLAQERALAKSITEEIEKLTARLVDTNDKITAIIAQGKQLSEVDTGPLQEQLRNAETINAGVRRNAQRSELAKRIADALARTHSMTDIIQQVATEKEAALASASWPIPGLSFAADGGLQYNGIPFAQASTAERYEVAIAIAFARNPKLKLVYLEHGSLLDSKTFQRVCDFVAANNGQVIFEIVGDAKGGVPSVVFEDGIASNVEEVK
jgi:hypothetical protein